MNWWRPSRIPVVAVYGGSLKQHLIVLDELGFIPFSSGAAQLLFQSCRAFMNGCGDCDD